MLNISKADCTKSYEVKATRPIKGKAEDHQDGRMSHTLCTNCIAQLARATWKLQPSVFVDGAHKTHKEQQEAEMKSSQFYACVE